MQKKQINKKRLLSILVSSVLASSAGLASHAYAADFLPQDLASMGATGSKIVPLLQFSGKTIPGITHWRIPSLLHTSSGTLVAAANSHTQNANDWGNVSFATRVSQDNGQTWGPAQIKMELASFNKGSINTSNGQDSAFLIDPLMVEDKAKKNIFMFIDMFPQSAGYQSVSNEASAGSGYIDVNGKKYLSLSPGSGQALWTLRENGEVFDDKGQKTQYTVIVNGDPALNFKDLGTIKDAKNNVLGNIYLSKSDRNATAPFTVGKIAAHLWVSQSSDGGKTWGNPVDLNPQVKKDWMRFLGTGPGTGVQTDNGTLLVPVYYTNPNDKQAPALIISKDNGKTWVMGGSPVDKNNETTSTVTSENFDKEKSELTESQVIAFDDNNVKLFMRNKSGHVKVATSRDGGLTWDPTVQLIPELANPYVQLSVIKYSKTINGKQYVIFAGATGPSRTHGKVLLGEVQSDGSITWDDKRTLAIEPVANPAPDATAPNYGYNSLAELGDGSLGLLYEGTEVINYQAINMQELFWQKGQVFSDIRQKNPLVFSYSGANNIEKIGDGIAIKQGTGLSQGGAVLSEGTLALNQRPDQSGRSLAFTNVTLNNAGILRVDSTQNINSLNVAKGATGYLLFNVVPNNNRVLRINDSVTSANNQVNVKVNLDNTLKNDPKGAAANLINAPSNASNITWNLVDANTPQGMYYYQLVASKGSDNRYTVRYSPKIIAKDGSSPTAQAMGSLTTLETPSAAASNTTVSTSTAIPSASNIETRIQVNPVMASYLSAGVAAQSMSNQMQQTFAQEGMLFNDEKQNIFVKYLHSKQHYKSDLGFTNYGYDTDTTYNGMMLGGKLWQSENKTNAVYAAINQGKYTVTPQAVDGATEANYKTWGINAAWQGQVAPATTLTINGGYQNVKGDIKNTSNSINGNTAYLGADVAYTIALQKSLSLSPHIGVQYQRVSLNNVHDSVQNADINYGRVNALKSSIGVTMKYQSNGYEALADVSYDMYKQKHGNVNVDGVMYQQGRLSNALNVSAKVAAHVTPNLSLSTGVGYQRMKSNTNQFSVDAGVRYRF